MARKKYPPIVVTATRPGGKTPPHLMSDEERKAWAYAECVRMAENMGFKPRKINDTKTAQ